MHFFKTAFVATGLIGLSLYLWRVAYALDDFGDWAILALTPLAVLLYFGFRPLVLDPWKARLRIALREESPLSHILTGKIRATLLSLAFTAVTIFLLAWRALAASPLEGALMLALVFISGIAYSGSQALLARHFHQPFARAAAISWATWLVALPFTLIVAVSIWSYTSYPGVMIDATFREALQIGIDNLPARRGWIAEVLTVPYAYEAGKLWVVLQLKEYPVVAAFFSLDAALFSIILARASIVVTQFIQSNSRSGV